MRLANKLIEIHGTGTHNKGAELMAMAIADHYRNSGLPIGLAVPRRDWARVDRDRYGFLLSSDFGIRGRGVRSLVGVVRHAFDRKVKDSKVSAVLDGSGFAFSDQWGAGRADYLSSKMSKQSRAHQALVLMPQALGPFVESKVRNAFLRLADRAALIFPRDRQSEDFVRELVPAEKIYRCPDFTIGVEGLNDDLPHLGDDVVAYVPNVHMMRKNNDPGGVGYLRSVELVHNELKKRFPRSVVVLHDAGTDTEVGKLIGDRVRAEAVFSSPDPRKLKAALGRCGLVVGSRFHALVSRLSYARPVIAIGWSHKYSELVSDVGLSGCIVDVSAHGDELRSSVERAVCEATSSSVGDRIQEGLSSWAVRISEMWRLVDDVVLGAGRANSHSGAFGLARQDRFR